MAHKTLTDLAVKNAKTDLSQIDIFDALTPGLAIRITKAGKKTWTFTYTSPRDQKRARTSLGTYPALGLEDARKAAIGQRSMVEQGKDPRDVVVVAPVADKTVSELVEDFLSLKVRGKLRTADAIERYFTVDIVPVIGSVPVKSVRIPHLNMCIDPVVKRGALIAANRVFGHVVQVMDFAVARGEIEFNPLAKAEKPSAENVRHRFLSTAEIVKVWNDLPIVMGGSKHVPTIMRLCLATGQRVGEVAGMTRSEIDLAGRVWTIPEERVKNGWTHVVPLSDLALSLIRDAMRATNSECLFPGPDGQHRVRPDSISTLIVSVLEPRLQLPLGRLGMEKWTPHDLRRTVATHMMRKEHKLGISRFDRALVLNHRSTTKATVTDIVYDKNDYLDEKRDALDKWGAFLAQLVGETVEIGRAA